MVILGAQRFSTVQYHSRVFYVRYISSLCHAYARLSNTHHTYLEYCTIQSRYCNRISV